tara:strand:- start:45 stop:335 length:291 start_codon:yes stop_codon:yes gene_type:complete
MSKILRQIINSGTKRKSGKKKMVRVSLDIEYYEKIQTFCGRYNRKINETLKCVLEEFVEEIEKNDPLVNTLLNQKKEEGEANESEGSIQAEESKAA